ncbi:MAG: DUF1622 domain-containing protein [Nitrosospira sp.]|nr:DUF1622 domain-containing protein [Nitrosospira sp.]
MIEIIKTSTSHLASGIEILAAIIILLAVIEATYRGLRLFFARPRPPEQKTIEVRLRLGRWLSLSLEFMLAADIISTIIAPSWEEIAKLAVIIVLRTSLNFFLEHEIRNSEKRGG